MNGESGDRAGHARGPGRATNRIDARAIRDGLRMRGLRWTLQRRTLVDVLARTDGHVTASALVERCRAVDPGTTPSTVYRTLDVLEELGVLRHAHGADGRAEFHVQPMAEHAHLRCVECGAVAEIDASEAAPLVESLAAARGFRVDLPHLSIEGRCGECAVSPRSRSGSRGR